MMTFYTKTLALPAAT